MYRTAVDVGRLNRPSSYELRNFSADCPSLDTVVIVLMVASDTRSGTQSTGREARRAGNFPPAAPDPNLAESRPAARSWRSTRCRCERSTDYCCRRRDDGEEELWTDSNKSMMAQVGTLTAAEVLTIRPERTTI